MKIKFQYLFAISLLILGKNLLAQTVDVDPADFFNANEIATANTAANADYMTKNEKDVTLYTNLARMYPKKFYNLFRAWAVANGAESKLRSNSYYTSLAKRLRSMDPVSLVLPERAMYELAECWAIESGQKGLIGHDRQECPMGYSGENCGYGFSQSGQYFVLLLIIDEGVKNLGHRENILHPDFKGLASAIRPHVDYKYCAVQNFSYTNDKLKAKDEVRRERREAEMAERAKLLEARKAEFDEAMNQWSDDEIKTADIARSANYLTEIEKELYLYINLMRTRPQKFKKLIWDNGPFFDQLLGDVKQTTHKAPSYKTVASWLTRAQPTTAILPTEEQITVGKCAAERYLKRSGNPTKCITGSGFRSWSLSTFYQSDNYTDVMNIFLVEDDFKAIFETNATPVIYTEFDQYAKVFLK